MKKILLTIMVLAFAVVGAACGNKEESTGNSDDVK